MATEGLVRIWRGARQGRVGVLVVVVLTAIGVGSQAALAAATATRPASVVALSRLAARGPLLTPSPDPVAQEEADLQPAASALLNQYGSNLAALRAAGQATIAPARNEATVEDFLHIRIAGRLIHGLERYAGMLAASDPSQVALGVAGVRYYSDLIHKQLADVAQLVVINLQAQHLTAYDSGRVVVDTAVTTGRPALSTDVGLMHVVRKDSPWTMHSPWPKGSPLWYPDTPVAMVAWFTSTGEGMHDAAWEPDSAFGPGSQNGPFASHGCVHLPLPAETTLFNWVTIGTPVVVIPGDGTPVDQQASQASVDAQGNPTSGTRGA